MDTTILELTEDELPDYINALLERNRWLEGENAALREEVAKLTAAIDYVTEETGYYTTPSEDAK